MGIWHHPSPAFDVSGADDAAPTPRSTHIKGPNFRRLEAIDALADAGFEVVVLPPGELFQAPDDRVLFVRTSRESTISDDEFLGQVEQALSGTGFKLTGGALPGSM